MKTATRPIVMSMFLLVVSSCSMNNDGGAIVLATKIVNQKLISPTTATFENEEVLERKGNLFLVYMTVDAHNVYGARLRWHYLVVFEIAADNNYYYKPTSAAQEITEPPTEISIDATKWANGWDSWKQH